MHIADLWRVELLAKQLRDKQVARNIVADGAGLNLTIQSAYQSDAMVNAVRGAVVAYLDSEIATLEDELRGCGVKLED